VSSEQSGVTTRRYQPDLREPLPRLSVVLPVRDVADRLLDGLEQLFSACVGLDHELVLIDLGSTDGTFELLDQFAAYAHVKLLAEEQPLAYGLAYSLGALVANGEAILLADIDRMLDNSNLVQGLRHLRDQAELVLYSPLVAGGGGASSAARWLAYRLRRIMVVPHGAPPCDPCCSVVLMRRMLAMKTFPALAGSHIAPHYEVLQLALRLGAAEQLAELPVPGRWAAPSWWRHSAIVREAKRISRR
jgi:cellulose synthase/poly-beta-1,6-N-acetylglucosamine synthase-like glycosyltransferase